MPVVVSVMILGENVFVPQVRMGIRYGTRSYRLKVGTVPGCVHKLVRWGDSATFASLPRLTAHLFFFVAYNNSHNNHDVELDI